MLNIYEIDGFKTKNNEVFAKYNIPENKIVLTNDLIDQAYFKLRGHKRYAYSKYYVNDELLYADGKAYNDYIYIDENFNYHETYPYNIIKYFKCGIIYVRDKFLMNAKGEIIYSLKDYDKVVFATNGFIKIASKEIDELAKSIRDFELILNSNGKVIGRYLRTSEILSNNIILVETFDNKTQLIQLKPYKILASGPHKCAEIIKKFADLKAKESNVASNIIHINFKSYYIDNIGKYLIKYYPNNDSIYPPNDKLNNPKFPFKFFAEVIAQKYNIPIKKEDNFQDIKTIVEYFNNQGTYMLDLATLEVEPLEIIKGIKISDNITAIESFDEKDQELLRIRRKE